MRLPSLLAMLNAMLKPNPMIEPDPTQAMTEKQILLVSNSSFPYVSHFLLNQLYRQHQQCENTSLRNQSMLENVQQQNRMLDMTSCQVSPEP